MSQSSKVLQVSCRIHVDTVCAIPCHILKTYFMITIEDPKGLSKRSLYMLYLLKITFTKESNLLQVYLCCTCKHAYMYCPGIFRCLGVLLTSIQDIASCNSTDGGAIYMYTVYLLSLFLFRHQIWRCWYSAMNTGRIVCFQNFHLRMLWIKWKIWATKSLCK